jgi:hypothetical protein
MNDRLHGLVLNDGNVLRVDATNTLCLDRSATLLIPAEDFELCEHQATSGSVPASVQRLGHVSSADRITIAR